MKNLLILVSMLTAVLASACITVPATTVTWTVGSYGVDIVNSNGTTTVVTLPSAVASTDDPDALLMSFPATFKVKIVSLSDLATPNHVELQYLSKSGVWTTIRKIENPSYSLTTDIAVSHFGLYPLDGKLGYAIGESFYVRLYISDGVAESLDYDSTEVDSDNPYYFKFKIDENRRAY